MFKKFKKSSELRTEGRIIVKSKIKVKHLKKTKVIDIPDDSHMKCLSCKQTINKEKTISNLKSCTKCNYLFRLNPRERISITFDAFNELFSKVNQQNPLKLNFYKEKLEKVESDSGENSAVTTGVATIGDQRFATFLMNHEFIMGSMGVVVGEKISQLFKYAGRHHLPVLGFVASGGARMQEGMYSLMQMAKTAAAVADFDSKGGLFIPVLTSPTYGGVTASFAMLGDIIVAEEDAMIGFAGKKVIKDAMKQDLPEGFQKAEFLEERGFVDIVSSRVDLKEKLYKILKVHNFKKKGRKKNGKK